MWEERVLIYGTPRVLNNFPIMRIFSQNKIYKLIPHLTCQYVYLLVANVLTICLFINSSHGLSCQFVKTLVIKCHIWKPYVGHVFGRACISSANLLSYSIFHK